MTTPDIGPPGTGFKLDHIVIRTPARDALVAEAAAATGLTALDGFAEGGDLHSRGVRFANGPFLDVFAAEASSLALILGGAIGELETRAAAQGWATRLLRQQDQPAGGPDFPWSMALFRRGQGLLTHISVIDYDPDPRAWAAADFDRPLYPIQPPPTAGAVLARVWLGAEDVTRAGQDLAALGYRPAGPVRSGFAPGRGERFAGLGADLVLCDGADGVMRLDVTTGLGPAREIALTGGPPMVLDEQG